MKLRRKEEQSVAASIILRRGKKYSWEVEGGRELRRREGEGIRLWQDKLWDETREVQRFRKLNRNT